MAVISVYAQMSKKIGRICDAVLNVSDLKKGSEKVNG
jgi:hypothetical protein